MNKYNLPLLFDCLNRVTNLVNLVIIINLMLTLSQQISEGEITI